MADKDDLSILPKPAKRARTSFTVDQLQVLSTFFFLLFFLRANSCIAIRPFTLKSVTTSTTTSMDD